MKKHMLSFVIATMVLLAFTACGQNQDTVTPPTELELVQEANSNQEPDYEYVNNTLTTAVRFYYHSTELDPNIYALPEAFLYNAVEIPVENLREEFIRLMYEHIGVHIQDYWFEGSKLYVDLHEDSGYFFDQHGTTGGMIATRRFERTLLSLPGTITSFEVLVNGQRGFEGNHFNFGHVAIVENGEVADREFFNLENGEEVATVIETTLPHPFATALREYMAGYEGVVRAYLATLDDDGTMGVLTTRPTSRVLVDYDTREYRYNPSTTLFYIQDGDLFQIDVSGWLFVSGRYNRLMERLYTHTHVVEFIYKLEFGRLEISTRLEYFSDEYLSYLFDGDYDIVAERIAERDALAEYAREKYGLVALPPPNFGHTRNAEDQTAQILAMTTNCVPSLIE